MINFAERQTMLRYGDKLRFNGEDAMVLGFNPSPKRYRLEVFREGVATEFWADGDDVEAHWAAEGARRAVLAAGTLTGVYPPGYLDDLRDEWD